MKLRHIKIENFRSLRNIEFEVGNLHAIVGANNSGKSNILRALNFFFNPSKRLIDEEAYWKLDRNNQISFEGIFDELIPEEISIFGPYLLKDNTFHLRRLVKFEPDNDSPTFDDGNNEITSSYLSLQPKIEWLSMENINGKNINKWWANPKS